MNAERVALWIAASTGVQVGATLVATRAVAADVDPATLALLRYAVGSAVMVPIALAAKVSWRIGPKDFVAIVALGILQFGILIWMLNWGVARVPAADSAVLFATFPLLAQIIAAGAGHEALSRNRVIGALLALAGVAVAMSGHLGGGQFDGDSLLGAVAVLGSALIGAACSVLYRPYLRRYSPLAVGAIAMLASMIALAPAAALQAAPLTLNAVGWAAVVGLGLSSGIFYWLWLVALQRIGPSRTTVFIALGPPSAGIIGALWLGEFPEPALWAGMIAVALGLRVATRR
jgi:drug/metabolite transporter (DMT)-like permease